jgi:uncharacterized membrane protein
MRSRVRLFGHPLHPILIVIPSTLFPVLALLDVLFYLGPSADVWRAQLWIAAAGVATTLLAGAVGLVDYTAIPSETSAKKWGRMHLTFGILTLLAYVGASVARLTSVASVERAFYLAAGIDVVGILLITVQGYLGGHLVYKHHLGVLRIEEGGEPVHLREGADVPAPTRAQRRRELRASRRD